MQKYTHALCFLAYLCGIVWAWVSLARQALRGGARQVWGYLLDAAVVVPLIMNERQVAQAIVRVAKQYGTTRV